MEHGLNIRIWGTRGSMPAPYPNRMQFGANTSCVSAEWEHGVIIFDCGSGIRALGDYLTKICPPIQKELHIFVSHLHLDHIIGLPFLPQVYQKDWTIHLYGAAEGNGCFREQLCLALSPPYWPVSLMNAGANMVWHELKEGQETELPGGIKIRTIRSNHPDTTTLFRLEKGNTSIVYGLDCELTESFYETYVTFVKHSDLLLFDGMYTEDEIERYRGFGHSYWEQGLRLIGDADIKQLCIMHHDWGREDSELERLEQTAQSFNTRCMFAREGMVFHFETGGM